MMTLKESFSWSDSQLYEQCRFNLLVRSAIGLLNMNDSLPVESTYYLFRKRVYEHQKETGEDLVKKAFENITKGQVREFDVNGSKIRMDSKLISSNIAFFSRYEIIHNTLCQFTRMLSKKEKSRLTRSDNKQLTIIQKEESQKTVYYSTRKEIRCGLETIGILMYKIISIFSDYESEQYQLLYRVFNEQYKVSEDKVQLRPREEITSDSVQSPHDPECSFRQKKDQNVKGYSVNVTETASEGPLNLVTNVIVEKANVPDTEFVQPAIQSTTEVTDQGVEKVYTDGAYQSPENDDFCKDIDMVYTGIQGFPSRYNLEMTSSGLIVTDTLTGETIQAVKAKRLKNSKEERWRIKTAKGNKYFGQLAIRASHLRNNKTRYRGKNKQKAWAYCRCLWINLVRIIKYIKGIYQKTSAKLKYMAPNTYYFLPFDLYMAVSNICWRDKTKFQLKVIMPHKYW